MMELNKYKYYINGELISIPWIHDLFMIKCAMCSKDIKLTMRKINNEIFINIIDN